MTKPSPSNDRVDISSDEYSSSDDVETDSIQPMAVDGPITALTPQGHSTQAFDREADALELCADMRISEHIVASIGVPEKLREHISDPVFVELLFRSARSYQEYMKLIPIPTERGTAIPYTSWMGLGNSIKQIYGQPLHYLTNLHLKQLDRERIGAEDENVPLDMIIHPCKAEASIWIIEQVHRRTSSPCHLAKLWETDPRHHVHIDAIFPKLSS